MLSRVGVAMAAPSRPPSKPYELDITIVSAKHLKNVNWLNGDLKPYAIFWVDPDRRLATKSDDSGCTRPVWNERFVLPLGVPPQDSILTLEIFHSKPSETPKPLVGTFRFPLNDLVESDDCTKLRTFELQRPSGRPQGKIRLKLAIRECPSPDYQITPQPSYYYSSATAPAAPPSVRNYRGYFPPPYTSSFAPPAPSLPAPHLPPSTLPSPPPPPPLHSFSYSGYSDPYSTYYPGYYSSPPPPPPPRPFLDRRSSYGGPSAPLEYAPYDYRQKSGKIGLGTGLAVGSAAGALGGLALEEGLKYEEQKIADRVESDLSPRDDYSDYRADY